MLCPQCGKELPENSTVCTECGFQFTDYQNISAEKPETAVSAESLPVKKSHKKAIIITSVAVAGAVAVGVPTFLLVKNGMTQQELKNNPTRYLAASVQKYFGEAEKETGIYNIAEKLCHAGSVKVTFNSGMADISARLGYDVDTRELYLDGSGKISSFGSNESQSGSVKAYANKDSVNVDYDIVDKKGSYFLDFATIRKDFEDSLFADKNSSLYNEQIEKFVDSLEKNYNLYQQKNDQMKKDFQTAAENLMKSFEKNGHVEITRESVNIENQNYSADHITYTFDATDMGLFLDDCKTEIIRYADTYKDYFTAAYDNFSMEELEKSLTSSIDSAKQSLDTSVKVVFDCYTDASAQSILKIQYTQTEGDNTATLTAEFPSKSDTVFSVNATNSGSKYGGRTSGFSLVRTDKDSNNVVYTFNYNDTHGQNGVMTFEHDKANAKLKISNTPNRSEDEDYDLTRPSVSIENKFSVECDFECTDDRLMIGMSDMWKVEFSTNPDISIFKGEKNFFRITEEELQQFMGTAYTRIDDDYDYGYDDTEKEANASMLDAACKKLYAGTTAGSINAETNPAELLDLDPSKLPAPTASAAQRREAAQKLTVQDAIDYDGLTTAFEDESPYDYAYSKKDGTIIYADENTDFEEYELLLGFEYTTLGELYNPSN